VDKSAATEGAFVLINEGRPLAVAASVVGSQVWLPADAVKAALGWELKPEGLCRGDVCVPVPANSPIAIGEDIDLAGLAALLRRPLALDLEERAAYLGAVAEDRGAALASLEAPDFRLPDLEGRVHSLSAHRGQKVLLVAYASW